MTFKSFGGKEDDGDIDCGGDDGCGDDDGGVDDDDVDDDDDDDDDDETVGNCANFFELLLEAISFIISTGISKDELCSCK